MQDTVPSSLFIDILRRGNPDATAWIQGNQEHEQLSGMVRFFSAPYQGILIEAEIWGLPNVKMPGATNFYGMHIHENGDCTRPFDKTGDHYSATPAMHPQHSGDLLPLFGNQGYAWMAFYNKRITLSELIGRSVVIHAMADDFTTQPSGHAGIKIGCGVIK